jgi:15-cis-phytoene synthase
MRLGDLGAAGITDPSLRAAYQACRRLNARHGKTFYLATRLLPPQKRPYVHALYGFARYADDIVDDLDPRLAPAERARRFNTWSGQVVLDLQRGESSDPVCRALIDTLQRWQISLDYVVEFLASMRMDLTVNGYQTEADLLGYMRGSAAVIGLQLLPILGRADDNVDRSALESTAADLGVAFQLTNFLRDIAEDLRRGRVYLPEESLRRFGVDRDRLARGVVDTEIRALLGHHIEGTRAIYRRAVLGVDLVDATSRPCLRTAITLYSAILEAIEDADYDVFSARRSVSRSRRVAIGVGGLVDSWAVRARRSGHWPRRPVNQTHHDSVASTRENPKSTSSTGA